MSLTLSGSGTIGGLVAGGLPDATITSAELASNAVDSQTLTLLNASGSAPVYACRAWVNFNGTGTVAIRASGNVSSITDNGTGNYTMNFATALPDVNYSAVGNHSQVYAGVACVVFAYDSPSYYSTTQLQLNTFNGNAGYREDPFRVTVAIFR